MLKAFYIDDCDPRNESTVEFSEFNRPIGSNIRKGCPADTDKNAFYRRRYSPYLVQNWIAEHPVVPATQLTEYNCKDRSIKTCRTHFCQYSGLVG